VGGKVKGGKGSRERIKLRMVVKIGSRYISKLGEERVEERDNFGEVRSYTYICHQ